MGVLLLTRMHFIRPGDNLAGGFADGVGCKT